ncbi:MAG TPA: prolyl oligopeptidase family serine peptidase [Rhizomicrobium sp.]|nr:prolyl oligopeptidase family serine peptidase [Rhizomicrobium sp.]
MHRASMAHFAAVAFGVLATANAQPADHPPVAPVRPVTDNYFGTKVTDPYRWMENRTDPEFIRYMLAQGAYTQHVLDRIPGRGRLLVRVAAHTGGGVLILGVQRAGKRLFVFRRAPAEDTWKAYVRETPAGPDRLLLDPDHYTKNGQHAQITFATPSQDGGKLAYGVALGGSGRSVIHVMDVASGKEWPETIDRADQAAPSWLPDGSGFFYKRMTVSHPGEPETARYLNGRAMLHRLGTTADSDIALIGAGVAGSPSVMPQDVMWINNQAGTDQAVATISHGSQPATELLIAPLAQAMHPGAHWRKIADTPDGVTNYALHGSTLYLLLHKDAPHYKIIALDLGTLDWSQAKTIVPESDRVIEDMEVASDGLYILDRSGGFGHLRRYDFATGSTEEVVLPVKGSVGYPSTDPLQSGALDKLESWLMPEQWYSFGGSKVAPLDLAPKWKDDLSAFVSEEVSVRARDGVMVPLSILRRKDLVRDGNAPLRLMGYGSYGITMSPRFMSNMISLLEDGGIYAVCHVRGGGEFGETWHLAGMKATKPNTWHDLIDCAKYMQAQGYASPATTAIEGGSAGGITVGMALTERPDLFRVVFSEFGDSNALRAEFETDGDGNALEYGSVKTGPGFRGLLAMDALSHVKDGVAYPAVMLTTGMNDPNVAPWQPGKMAARLQKATVSGRPVLLRVDTDAGHGSGPTKQQADSIMADQMAFMYWQMGKPEYQPSK